jgi:hypothetical protein
MTYVDSVLILYFINDSIVNQSVVVAFIMPNTVPQNENHYVKVLRLFCTVFCYIKFKAENHTEF